MCLMTADRRDAIHRKELAAMAKPINPETVLRARLAAEEIIRAGEGIVTVSGMPQLSPKLARHFQGATGMAACRALLKVVETDSDLRRKGEAQGIDWEAWADSLETAGLEGKRV